jgi:hypothetical protein
MPFLATATAWLRLFGGPADGFVNVVRASGCAAMRSSVGGTVL